METSDLQLEVALDWVIVRGGPGSWARNVDWDEYLLRVRNLTEETITLTAIRVYDALDVSLKSSNERKQLVKDSRAVVKRFKGQHLKVKAGVGGATLATAGLVTSVAGMGVGLAAVTGSSAAASAAGIAVVGVFAAPVLIAGGLIRAMNNNRIDNEIAQRSVKLPLGLDPDEEQDFHVFFPLAPSPKKLELVVVSAGSELRMAVDTSEVLHGLHLVVETQETTATSKAE